MRADAILIELVAEHHMVADRALVRRAGLNDDQWQRRLQHDTWVQVVPGQWRHAATPLTWEMQVRAGAAWLGRSAALHGTTAGRWWELDGCESSSVEFLVPRARRHVPPWLTLHTTTTWAHGDLLVLRGVRTSSATRAIIDMARTESPRRLEAAIDSAVRLRRTSVPTLSRRMSEMSGRGRAGIRVLRTLVLDSGGESYLERAFLRLVRAAGLPRPTPQVVHRSRDGKVMRVDFEFHDGLIVEVSGRRGHSSDRDRQRDARRRNDLQSSGWVVLEFTTADVLEDPAYVEALVRAHLSTSSSRHRKISGRGMT